MLSSTQGVVLHSLPYTDTSLIVRIYTKDFGLQTYISRGARSKKNSSKAQHFQALRVLELEISSNPKAKLQNIKSSAQIRASERTTCDIVRTSLAIFMTEVLNLSIKENGSNAELFDFLLSWVERLETCERDLLADFHLCFLVDLSLHLGFCPNDNYSEFFRYFDLQAGQFVAQSHSITALSLENSFSLHRLLSSCACIALARITENKSERRILLDELLKFYAIHITQGKQIRSQEILSVILS